MSSFLNVSIGILFIIAIGLFMPVGSLPVPIASSIKTIFGFVYILDPIIPVSTIFTMFGIYFTIELVIFSWKGLNWISRTLRGI